MDDETRRYLDGMEKRIEERIKDELADTEKRIKDELIEAMRDMQTEIIRAMTKFQASNEARDDTHEARYRAQETHLGTLDERMALTEKRLREIELRLLGGQHP